VHIAELVTDVYMYSEQMCWVSGS